MNETITTSEKNNRNSWWKTKEWAIILVLTCFIAFRLVTAYASQPDNSKYISGAATAQEALEQYIEKTYPEHADSYNILMIKEYSQFAVGLYKLPGDSTNEMRFQYVQHYRRIDWYIDGKSSEWDNGLMYYTGLRSHVLLESESVFGTEHTVVYGKTLSDDVAYVEVAFVSGGQTIRVDVENGLFVIVSPSQDRRAGAIRALDADGNVLAELD